jgi:acyl carrier protein
MIPTSPSPEAVRRFLLMWYAEQLKAKYRSSLEIPDTFDLLLEGIVDSLGILEMVSAVEREFGVELDMEGLEAEQITVLGPFARYVAEQAGSGKNGPDADPLRIRAAAIQPIEAQSEDSEHRPAVPP